MLNSNTALDGVPVLTTLAFVPGAVVVVVPTVMVAPAGPAGPVGPVGPTHVYVIFGFSLLKQSIYCFAFFILLFILNSFQ